MVKNSAYFKKKEELLNEATKRVEKILEAFKSGKRKDVDNWNYAHDLEDRILDRLWNNWSEFKDWHWDKFGFNTYP